MEKSLPSPSASLPLPTREPRLQELPYAVSLTRHSYWFTFAPRTSLQATSPGRRVARTHTYRKAYTRDHASFAYQTNFPSRHAHETALCVGLLLPPLPSLTIPFCCLLWAFLHSFWASTIGHLELLAGVRVTRARALKEKSLTHPISQTAITTYIYRAQGCYYF